MTGLLRGVGIGAGLLTLGYGIYRVSRGRRDGRTMQFRRWMRRMKRTVTQFSRPMMRRARKQMARMKMPQIRVQILPASR